MKLEHESLDALRKKLRNIIGKYLDLEKYKLFFFGSRVSGGGSERSDIDIGIDGPEPVPLKVFSDIKEEIEDIPILYKIEIVDFKQVSPDFRQVALEHTEVI